MTEYLDLLIPRGGARLIRAVVENAKVPVIETGVGNCHVYVDKDADIEMAAISFQRENLPSVRLQRHRNDLGAQGHCRSGAARHLK